MTILALDLAAAWGWAVVDGAGRYVDSGHRTLTSHHLGERLNQLTLSVCDLITEYAPEIVVVEEPVSGKRNYRSARSLYAYAAEADRLAWLHRLGYSELTRAAVCKAIHGSAKATDKSAAIAWAQQHKPGIDDDDEADALMLAMAAHSMRGMA